VKIVNKNRSCGDDRLCKKDGKEQFCVYFPRYRGRHLLLFVTVCCKKKKNIRFPVQGNWKSYKKITRHPTPEWPGIRAYRGTVANENIQLIVVLPRIVLIFASTLPNNQNKLNDEEN